MKPGDLVITVDHAGDDLEDSAVGLHGVIVERVTLEDGHPINSWCDWWVLIDSDLSPWAEKNLEVINGDALSQSEI